MLKKSILVTGASSGLGYATVLHLQKQGFYVFAAVREIKDIFKHEENITEIRLDITNEQSIHDAFQNISSIQHDYPLWGLVNNAGICIPSPLELLPADELRRQLDTNVIGQLSVTQIVLPLIRANKGRIINVTSGLGSIAVPYLGAYSIAQFAKMAFTDALRRELKNSGVSVSVVQPGAINTPIWEKFISSGKRTIDQIQNPIKNIYENSFNKFLNSSGVLSRSSTTSINQFTKVISDILTSPYPESHYYVGDDAKSFIEKSKISTANEIDEFFIDQIPSLEDFNKPPKDGVNHEHR